METLYKKQGNKYIPVGAQTYIDLYPGVWFVENTKTGSRMLSLRLGDSPIVDVSQSTLIRLILEYVAEYINKYKLGTLSEKDNKIVSNQGYSIAFDMYASIIDKLSNEVKHNQEAYDKWFVEHPSWSPEERHSDVVLRAFDRIIKEFEDDSPKWHGLDLTNLHRLLDAINSETYKLIGTPFYNQLMHLLKTHFKEYCVIKQIIK